MAMSFKEFSKRFPRALEAGIKDLRSKKNMDDLGKTLADEVELRTRLGKGVSKSEGKVQKLRPLKPATIKTRKRMKKEGELSSRTTPPKSNLTAIGIMLGSIIHKAKKNFVKVTIKDVDYAEFVHDSRPFMHLSKKQVKNTIKRLQDKLVDSITKLLR